MDNFNISLKNSQLALQLAERGWYVFPCKPDKSPYTAHGKDDATLDPEKIGKWWQRWPDALIGIYCQKSGLFAVDIDLKDGRNGQQAWDDLVITHGAGQPPQAGPIQQTPSGGYHILFRYPEDLAIPNNSNQLAPGLDLRSNGYICTGGPYTWLDGFSWDSPLTDAPVWLLDLIRGMKARPALASSASSPSNGHKPHEEAGEYWLQKALDRAAPGNRNETGFWLACQLRDAGLSAPAAEAFIKSYSNKLSGGPTPYTEREALASLHEAYKAPRRETARLAIHQGNGQRPAGDPPEPEPPEDPSLSIDPTAELANWADLDALIGPIEWDWKGWIPRALLTIIASESGTGKSALMLRIADCFIRGSPWPDGSKFEGETGAVLWCEAEAAQAINLERAKKWGIPLDCLKSPLANLLEDFRLDNPYHKAALASAAFRPEVRYIAIDSLSGADSKSEKSTEDSSNVLWLAALARDSGKPIMISHHLRQRSIFDGEKVDLDRLRGSSAIVQPARIVWALDIPDPQDKDTKRLQVVKSNLCKFPDPVGMTISDAGVKFGQAPETPKIETVADKAVDLLMALLDSEPLPAEQVEQEFDHAGISKATMKRAKARLGIVSVKDRDGWKWSLPQKGVSFDN